MIVGNTIVGSRLLLQQILQGWKADAAIAFAPVDTWIEALRVGLDLSCSMEEHSIADALDILEATVAEIEYHSEDLITGQGVANYPYHPHHGVRQALSLMFRIGLGAAFVKSGFISSVEMASSFLSCIAQDHTSLTKHRFQEFSWLSKETSLASR